MKASRLIGLLANLIEIHGDSEVVVFDWNGANHTVTHCWYDDDKRIAVYGKPPAKGD